MRSTMLWQHITISMLVAIADGSERAHPMSPFVCDQDVTLAVGRRLDVSPVVLGTDVLDHTGLEGVERVDHQRAIVAGRRVDFAKCRQGLLVAADVLNLIDRDTARQVGLE
jgi:hypothetical protein